MPSRVVSWLKGLGLSGAGAVLLCATGSALAQDPLDEDQDDGSYRTFIQGGVGFFTGDYGLPEDTDVGIVSFNARRYLRRGEVRVSIPYLKIDGPADIYLIGGQAIGVPRQLVVGSYRKESGLGDIVVRGDYYLRYGTQSSPWVIGIARAKLPTGDEDKGLGTGSTDYELGLSLIQPMGRMNWLVDIGYTAVGDPPSAVYELENVVRIGTGLTIPFPSAEQRSLYAYLENRTNVIKGEEDRRSLALGIDTPLDPVGRLRLSGSVFVGLTDTSEKYGVYLTLGRRF